MLDLVSAMKSAQKIASEFEALKAEVAGLKAAQAEGNATLRRIEEWLKQSLSGQRAA